MLLNRPWVIIVVELSKMPKPDAKRYFRLKVVENSKDNGREIEKNFAKIKAIPQFSRQWRRSPWHNGRERRHEEDCADSYRAVLLEQGRVAGSNIPRESRGPSPWPASRPKLPTHNEEFYTRAPTSAGSPRSPSRLVFFNEEGPWSRSSGTTTPLPLIDSASGSTARSFGAATAV